jgi:hypothetical protein
VPAVPLFEKMIRNIFVRLSSWGFVNLLDLNVKCSQCSHLVLPARSHEPSEHWICPDCGNRW